MRRGARVEPRGQRVLPEERGEACVPQLPGADLGEGGGTALAAQRTPPGLGRVRLAPGQDLPVGPEGFLQQGTPGAVPGVPGAVEEGAPPLSRPVAEGRVEGGGDLGARGVRQVGVDPVGEDVADGRVRLGEVDPVLQGLAAGLQEEVAGDRREGQQSGPGVEGEAVPAVRAEGPAVRLRTLVHLHVVPRHRQPCGRRHGPHAGADHRDSCHGPDSMARFGTAAGAVHGPLSTRTQRRLGTGAEAARGGGGKSGARRAGSCGDVSVPPTRGGGTDGAERSSGAPPGLACRRVRGGPGPRR